MKDKEINRVIAEYMGWVKQDFPTENEITFTEDQYCDNSGEMFGISHFNYTESLDALVPVWEKLNLKKISPRFAFSCSQKKPFYCEIMYSVDERDDWDGSFYSIGKTIQQAAAHATAKAILELKD